MDRTRTILALAILLAAFVLFASCGGDDDSEAPPETARDEAAPTPAPPADPTPAEESAPAQGHGAAEESIAGTDETVAGPTANLEALDSPVLQRIDPGTNRLVATVPIAGTTTEASFALGKRQAVSQEAVWVISPADQSVQRLDVETNALAGSIGVRGTPTRAAADSEFVWVASRRDEENVLTKISAISGDILSEIDLGSFRVTSAVADGQAVWVVGQSSGVVLGEEAGEFGGMLLRIDRDTDEPTAIPVGAYPQDVAVGEGFVWVAGSRATEIYAETVERIEPATNTVERAYFVRSPAGGRATNLVAGEGSVWLGGDELTRIDPQTLAFETIDHAQVGLGEGPFRIAVGHGSVWVAADSGIVSRMDSDTVAVVAEIRVGARAAAVTVGQDAVWVEACREPPASEYFSCTLNVSSTGG